MINILYSITMLYVLYINIDYKRDLATDTPKIWFTIQMKTRPITNYIQLTTVYHSIFKYELIYLHSNKYLIEQT